MWRQIKEAIRGQPPQETETGNVKQIKRRALVKVKEIGKGTFSDVYEMTWKSPNGPINVAAKKLHKKDTHELEILSNIDHPNIVKLIGVVDEDTDFMLILELCEGGSLRSCLENRNGRKLPGKQFYDWAEQAAKPLEYLQEKHLVHKDLKSPNYLVTAQGTLKLGDFGIAKNIDQTIDDATTTASYRWMAPELLVKGVLSPKFDIFALAVVLWELWTVLYPWDGIQSPTIVYKVCNENERLPIPEDCPESLKELLIQCWQTDWKQRPDIVKVLQVITSLSRAAETAAREVRQRQIMTGPWNMVRKFDEQDGPGKLVLAYHMTFTPDGSVVVADNWTSHIKIYSIEGVYKSSIHTHRKPRQITVSSDNTCFVIDGSQHITMYELSGNSKGSWVTSCPDESSRAPRLCGLAMDHAGDLLLGDCSNNYINKHHQDGTHVASIKVGIEPRRIAVTSQGTIVIAAMLTSPQVISNTGQVLHTLKLPEDESQWYTHNVSGHDGIIFVCNEASILCYSESGEYLGSMPIPYPPVYPRGGIVMTSDSKTLLVCDLTSVKVYTTPSVQQ